MKRMCIVLFAVLAALGCGAAPESSEEISVTEAPIAGATAAGVIPAGLPARLAIGLFEDTGATWMRNSGVPWDTRYRYFTKGWVNNWGWSPADGSWGLAYLRECDQQGYLPAIQLYQLFGEPGGGEAQTLQKVQNATTMRAYFGDVKTLLSRVKDFGKPTLLLLEADTFGFLQQQTAGNPGTYAAIAASGMPELAGLPDTVAGFGLAFLRLRESVGAPNAVLGIHVSSWATNQEISYYSVTIPLSPEVDKAYAFLAPFGLTANVTGKQFDVLVGDPLDRDSDYYRITQGSDRWWDPSDTASLTSKSFNRYAEWLRLWNVKASKRWVLWQIPLGNSNHRNVYNNGGPGEGYKDNRTEYFFGNGTAHLEKFADVGVVSLLFGGGASGMSSYTNDTYGDGQLFLQSRARPVLQAGGVPLATSPGQGGGSGGATGAGGATSGGASSGGSGSGADPAQYGFESGTQAFVTSGSPLTVSTSTTRAFQGTHSLRARFSGSPGSPRAFVANPTAKGGAVISFRVWIPASAPLVSVQPYVQEGASGGWAWTGSWRAASSLSRGQWNTITVTVPAGAAPLAELGVQFTTSASWLGSMYVDSVSW